MPAYRVHLYTTLSASVEVEAEDREAAIDAAYGGELPTLCAQCSGWGSSWSADLGDDWEVQDEGVTDLDGEPVSA